MTLLPKPKDNWQHFPEADIAEYTGPHPDDPAHLDALRQKIQEIRAQKAEHLL